MAQTKAQMTPAETLKGVQTYVQGLVSGKDTTSGVTIGKLLGERIDRVRLYQTSDHQRVKLEEVTLPKRMTRARAKRKLDPLLVSFLERLEDPEISVDFTVDMATGAISMQVETEAALEGQDLAKLAAGSAEPEPHEFEDVQVGDACWTAEQAATELGSAKSTVTRQVKANKIIGFKLFKNALYIPREQFMGKLPVRGLSEILEMFECDHFSAWQFLSTAFFYGESDARPIDRLRSVKSQEELVECLDELTAVKQSFDYGDHS